MTQVLNNIRLPDELDLRAARPEDHAFMERLFRSTREQLYAIPMAGELIDALADQQFRLQQAGYAERFPNARTLILQLSGEPIGRIVLDENETSLHIIDIAIERGMRGKGYGTAVLRAIQKAATECRGRITLSVDRQNLPARSLYHRLGFRVSGTSETHESMSWSPSSRE